MTARLVRVLPFALAAVAACGYAAASLFRHGRFGSNGEDLGIYDQTVWGYSHFDVSIPNTVLRTPTLLIDHFQPILFTLAPLYWLWEDARMLLVVQAVLLAAASLPIFLWARDRLGVAPALGFQTAYLVFFGVLGGNIYDFHEAAFTAPILALGLYAMLERRDRLLLVAIALLLVTKENLALTAAALGLYVALAQRRPRLGLPIAAVSLAWFVVVFEWALPAIADAPYANWFYPALGPDPGSALRHVVLHPIDSVQLLFEPAAKRTGLFNLFAPWLFLPLLSPLVLVALPTIGERFLADKPAFWAQGFHYSLVIAPILAFAAIDATARLRRRLSGRAREVAPVALAAAILLAGVYFSFGRLKPLDELRRYTSAAHAAEIRDCLDTIPPDASVSATSALVPHLSHRRRIYQLDERPIPQTRFYALDLYTWIFPFTVEDAAQLVERSLANGYGVRCTKTGTVVLERGAPGRTLSPELQKLFAG
jgi:uncharacterized membrane protein